MTDRIPPGWHTHFWERHGTIDECECGATQRPKPDVAAVLAGVAGLHLHRHEVGEIGGCICGWSFTAEHFGTWAESHRIHVAAEQAAALAPLFADARAQAWDEGMRTGTSRAMRMMSDEPSLPLASSADNPYRLAALTPDTETETE